MSNPTATAIAYQNLKGTFSALDGDGTVAAQHTRAIASSASRLNGRVDGLAGKIVEELTPRHREWYRSTLLVDAAGAGAVVVRTGANVFQIPDTALPVTVADGDAHCVAVGGSSIVWCSESGSVGSMSSPVPEEQ